MSWSTGAQKTSMALQVEIELGRMSNLAINDSACRTVATLITVTFVGGEESSNSLKSESADLGSYRPNMVAFTNHNDGDFWINSKFSACL